MQTKATLLILLAISLSLAGCLEGAIGVGEGTENDDESESSQYVVNQEPLIYGSFANCGGECYYEGDWYDSLVSASEIFAVDPDGSIADFGMDWDNDFEIDWSFPWNWNESHSEKMPQFDYTLMTINPPTNTNNPDGFCSTGYMNLIAEDNLGLKEIKPMKWRFDWDTEEQVCLTGLRS